MRSRGEVSPHVDEGRVQLDAAGIEAEQVRHDRDDARSRSPLKEPSARLTERHKCCSDGVVVGGDEGVPVVLANLRVETVPILTTLLAQRIDACA